MNNGTTESSGVAGVRGLPRSGLRLVNREYGSDARRVLNRELDDHGIDPGLLPGYETAAAGHLEVAAAIAAGVADVGVASEPIALAYELTFVPLTWESFDLVIPAAHAGSREVRAMVRALSSRWLLDQPASLPGYDASRCGEHLAPLQAPGGQPSDGRRLRYRPQRVASGGSDALLLDEPYAGLDADLRRSLTEPVHAREVPAVFVAHELAEAQAFADMHPERVAPARIPARG